MSGRVPLACCLHTSWQVWGPVWVAVLCDLLHVLPPAAGCAWSACRLRTLGTAGLCWLCMGGEIETSAATMQFVEGRHVLSIVCVALTAPVNCERWGQRVCAGARRGDCGSLHTHAA